jgi:hypothetical protein
MREPRVARRVGDANTGNDTIGLEHLCGRHERCNEDRGYAGPLDLPLKHCTAARTRASGGGEDYARDFRRNEFTRNPLADFAR